MMERMIFNGGRSDNAPERGGFRGRRRGGMVLIYDFEDLVPRRVGWVSGWKEVALSRQQP